MNVLRFAKRITTELGEEKQCLSCGEFWPADAEFFERKKRSADGLSPRCLACIKDRVWRLYAGIAPNGKSTSVTGHYRATRADSG